MKLSSASSMIASRWTGTFSWSSLTSCGGKQPQQMPMLTLDPVPALPRGPPRPRSRFVSARSPMSFNAHRYGECTSCCLRKSTRSARAPGVKYHPFNHVWWNGLRVSDTGTHCLLPSIPPLFLFSTLPQSPYIIIAHWVQNSVFLAWRGLHRFIMVDVMVPWHCSCCCLVGGQYDTLLTVSFITSTPSWAFTV